MSEFFNMTQITASTAGSVVVTEAGNHLAEVTPAPIDLPIVTPTIDAYYEPREGMRVTFVDTLTVSEYFELARYGTVELFEGGRPAQFTEVSAPSVAGYAAQLDALARRLVILDDDDNAQNAPLALPDGSEYVFHPRANGGFSVGTQGTDFFRGGDQVTGLTGVLHWSFAGQSGTDAWRIRPTAANPAVFTAVNPRPATPPAVGGAIRAASVNLLNYFTTIDTTASNNTGPCGPDAAQDCRGADSVAELNRQRERASIVLCGLDADVARPGRAREHDRGRDDHRPARRGQRPLRRRRPVRLRQHRRHARHRRDPGRADLPLGDARRRSARRSSTLDAVHNRPPTAQTFDVVDAANPAFGAALHGDRQPLQVEGLRRRDRRRRRLGRRSGLLQRAAAPPRPPACSPGSTAPCCRRPAIPTCCCSATSTPTRRRTRSRRSPAAGSPTCSPACSAPRPTPTCSTASSGISTTRSPAPASPPQVIGVAAWHINADEIPLFDYSDEVADTGEAAFEEKPDGSALVPPRVRLPAGLALPRLATTTRCWSACSPTADLSITKTDGADPVIAGTQPRLHDHGRQRRPGPGRDAWRGATPCRPARPSSRSPRPAAGAARRRRSARAAPSPARSRRSPSDSAAFTLIVHVDPAVAAGTVLSNTASATAATGDPDTGDRSATATTTVGSLANISLTKGAAPSPVVAGTDLTYTLTASNEGPSNAASAQVSDPLPAGTTFVSLVAPAGWSCATPAVGSGGTVTCTTASFGVGSALFTIVVHVDPALAPPALLANTATLASTSSDPEPGDNVASTSTPVASVADLAVAKSAAPSPVAPGDALTYTLTLSHAGPSTAQAVTLSDPLPAGTTFVSLAAPAGWGCATPAVGSGGTVTCSLASMPAGSALFTLVVTVDAGAVGTDLVNTATAATTSTDNDPADNSATATTPVRSPALVTATKSVSGAFLPGSLVTYTVVLANAGPEDQLDNPGDEFTDVLPAELALTAASASAGTAFADVPNATVTWNGVIPAGGSVTVTIQALLAPGLADGTLVVNQGTFAYDADGNGTNEASGATDDPATGTAGDPTEFVVFLASLQEIPTLDTLGLALLALALAALAMRRARRRTT